MARTYRTGIVRASDNLGRVVLSKEMRDLGGIQPGDHIMQTLVVDEITGRIRGILLEPVAWVVDETEAPEFKARLAGMLKVQGRGEEVDL